MKGLLKFVACGSVDDGKSTLIGHMLYDAKLIYADQKHSLEMDSRLGSSGGKLDYSLLLDGLMAEREQGITIDVAYRYFSTERRSFIVADAPGHEEYTRNMAVGASFADLALILVDVLQGVLPQTRRHVKICSLMGIRSFVFAVNKMDLVKYAEKPYRKIEKEIRKLAIDMDLTAVEIIPVSATEGDNIIAPSPRMPWYSGTCGVSLLAHLESVDIDALPEEGRSLLPIQRVCRPDASFRGFQGEVISGRFSVGDNLVILPSKERASIKKILAADRECTAVGKGRPATICLDREVDVSRGCVFMGSHSREFVCQTTGNRGKEEPALDRRDAQENHSGENLPMVGNLFVADVLWMDDSPLVAGREFWCKIATKLVPATVLRIKYILDIQTGERMAAGVLEKNGIASCEIALAEKAVFDSFHRSRELGGFILVNRVTHATSACGMIHHPLRRSENLIWQNLDITREFRAKQLGQTPKTLWFTGLSGSGKSTLANGLEKILSARGMHTMLLDGDNVRMGLNRDLGFLEQDRVENIRRVAEVAKLMNDAGLIVLVSFISPYRADRERAREIIGAGDFVEIYVSTPLEVCEARDVKGLYRKAREGRIPNFTGISNQYEPPLKPEVSIDTSEQRLEESLEYLTQTLNQYVAISERGFDRA